MKTYFYSGLILISLSSWAQEKKIDCEEIRKNPDYQLIYQVRPGEASTDIKGDEALWGTFKRKFSEKIPALFGNRKLLNRNQSIRTISLEEKEQILKCFHGDDFKVSQIEGNKLEETIPLLDENDPARIKNIFFTLVEEEDKFITEQPIQEVLKGLESVESINQGKSHLEGLTCLEDLPGIESKKNPLNKAGMVQMFQQVICATGIPPKLGETHKWHKDFPPKGPKPPFSKLLVALANGDTNRIMPTGKENDLAQWILKQEPRSITIHQMFEQAYRLNQGDVYSAFLTVENVLSQNFYLGGSKRERLTISTKLGKIINHTGGEFDLFGPWYHLFGMLLYGYAEESAFKASLMGKIETGTSLFYHEYNDRQENYMIKGGVIGVKLKKLIKQMDTPNGYAKLCQGVKTQTEVSDYLDLDKGIPQEIDFKKLIKQRFKRKKPSY